MPITRMDADPAHLWPAFREKVAAVLAEVETATGEQWDIVEGLRSTERQLWLYASGRTRPGNKVTWIRTPLHHGRGLAADLRPARVARDGYGAIPHSRWEALRVCWRRNGLENPAWARGDFQHMQWPAKDKAAHVAAGIWVRAGFPKGAPKPPPERSIRVFFAGEEIEDADAYFERPGIVAVALRPVTEALDWSISQVDGDRATLVWSGKRLPGSEERKQATATIDLIIKKGRRATRGYVLARDLGRLTPVEPVWDKTQQTLSFEPDTDLDDEE